MSSEITSRSVAYLLQDVLEKKFDYGFYEEELWAYVSGRGKPIIEYEMEDVKHWVYSSPWSYQTRDKEEEECFVSIYQVLLQRERFTEHWQRIKQADLQYPLIVIEDDFDKYGSILDGNHRFAKMITEDVKKVKLQFISKAELMFNLYRKI